MNRTEIPRADHNLSRQSISENALKVLYRLKGAGFKACLVGGGVRDLLLQREPKDFDISTDATPEEIKKLFRNCRLIGRRFRLAHVHFGSEIIEVATFRGQHEGDQGDDGQIVDGMIVRDNVYGTMEEDAWRRDFTVNSLYYDIANFSVIDYVDGMEDLRQKQLRLIGEPEVRYREDPVRMLRAVRFAAKLSFQIESKTEAPMFELSYLLESVPPARLFEEMLKLFLSGHALETFYLLRRYSLFQTMFPQTAQAVEDDVSGACLNLIEATLRNTDDRVREGKPVTPSFLMASLLWCPVDATRHRFVERGMTENEALAEAADAVISGQNQRIAIPRRFHIVIRDIWHMQDRLSKRAPKRSLRLLSHPRFRAGYDFLLLCADAGLADAELAQWWTDFSQADESQQNQMLRRLGGNKKRKRRPKKQ